MEQYASITSECGATTEGRVEAGDATVVGRIDSVDAGEAINEVDGLDVLTSVGGADEVVGCAGGID